LPKQVLWDILDLIYVYNDSDQPFDHLKEVLLRQFGKSKWQSYFDLLRLPMEMQGLKPSALMGKLKQHLPPGVSPDTDLFLSVFLIRLPPSMREAVDAGNHKTGAAVVKAVGRRLVGCSRRPQPHGRGCHDTEKLEPSSSKQEEE
jgi:hypothetical protein